jgi:single-stranded-DNA-specific exonuclease
MSTELRGNRALWRLEAPFPREIRDALQGESVMISHLLYYRGYTTAEAIRGFWTQGNICHDPYLMPGMQAAAERLARAIADRERVAVYGDFDCDGITSAAVLVFALQALGLDPSVHIPDRDDGHGLHPEAVAALSDTGVTLIVTADCGVTAMDEVRVARGMGMDVVITDHHEARPDGSRPDCPVVNPRRLDSEYPYPYLCGVGVAYKLIQALADRVPGALDPDELLDLVALGTIADVVPLQDENRSLVVRGLQRLRETRRPGLLALFEAAGIERSRIDPTAVGYYLAPRINAANRMATPQKAYELMTASDPATAAVLAGELSLHNRQRQLLVAEKFEEITEQLGVPATIAAQVQDGSRPPLLVIVGDWPPGISGLLASKLVDAYGLPAFVGSQSADGVVSVSARSVPRVAIDELLERCEAALPGGLFLGYGGHARAGGFRVDQDKLSAAQEILHEQGRQTIPVDQIGAVLTIDAEIGLRQVTLDAAKRIRALAPFGMGFPEPLFLTRGVTVRRVSAMGGGKHCRVALQQSGAWLDGVCFNAPEMLALSPGTLLDAVFQVQLDEWQGMTKLQLVIRDWRLAGGALKGA